MLSGYILDCYPEYNKNKMILWISGKNRTYRLEEKYEPSFFTYSSKENLYILFSILNVHPFVEKVSFTHKKIDLFSEKEKRIQLNLKKAGTKAEIFIDLRNQTSLSFFGMVT